MTARSDFLLDYFQKLYILLKDDWLSAAIDYLHENVRDSRQLPNERFASLVFHQWLHADFDATSFAVFANHQLDTNATKRRLGAPLVCQIQNFRDVGSACYAQLNSLSGNSKDDTDGTGFERVFREKEENHDEKPSRVLKMTVTDGETELKAVEFWKIPTMSVHLPPGSKLHICPSAAIRSGVFLLKPHNSRVLGGEVAAIFKGNVPIDQLARSLGISAHKPEKKMAPAPMVPSANVSRYLAKKPAPRPVSPDVLAESDASDDSFDNFEAPSSEPQRVNVSSLLNRRHAETEEFETRKRLSAPVTPPSTSTSSAAAVVTSLRGSGMLTSRRSDPMDDLLENMIEQGEEPVSRPKPTVSSLPPPKKMIKMERADSNDDDIQIIEPAEKSIIKKEGESPPEYVELMSEEHKALESFARLKLTSLVEAGKKMRYSVGARRCSTLAFIEEIAEPLRVVDGLWTMKVELRDDSGDSTALIDNRTLEKLLGYTCDEAMAVRKSKDLKKRQEGKRRLEALEEQLQRLDLVFEIEFFAGTNATSSCPVVRSMTTLAETLDIF